MATLGRITAVALLLAGSTVFADSASTIARAEARHIVVEFAELAKWCTQVKLLKTRNRLFESILTLQPNHAVARKWLRYKKNKEGKWVRGKYRQPKDFKPEHLSEFRRRREAITAAPCKRLLALLDSDDEEPSPGGRYLILTTVIAADPDNIEARQRNDEVKVGNRWVLSETETARTRRKEFAASVREIRKKTARPRGVRLSGLEQRAGMMVGFRGAR